MPQLLSVNVGLPQDVTWNGKTVRTAIWKLPVEGRRMVRKLNIDGDAQADLGGHGGEQRAVFVYQMDSYHYWEHFLGRNDFSFGQFGENFTVDGLADNEVCIGDRYRIGDALFEVTQPRVTCYRVGVRLNEPRMPALLVAHKRPGFYFRVLQEGEVGAGDEIVKVADGPERLTVAHIDALLYLPGHSHEDVVRALRVPALSKGWQASFQAILQQGSNARTDAGNPGLANEEQAPAWPGFKRVRVSDIRKESESVTSFVLVPIEGQDLPIPQPGQFIVLRLQVDPDKPPILRRPEDYDLVILGGGTGSTVAAWTFAGEGNRVAVVDRKYIGGSCPNIACLPSKNIIHSAKVASYFRRSKEFGITDQGYTIDMSGVRNRKRKMVSSMNEMYLENYRRTGAEFLFGTGRFIAPRTVEATLPDGSIRHLRGTNVIVSTGTRASLAAVPGLAGAQPLTHIEALELNKVPEHLLVIGGGYVGIELSQAMRRFGSHVSVIDPNKRLMSKEDEDVCEALRNLLEDEGIDIHLDARIKRVSGKSGQSVDIVVEQHGAEDVLKGTHLLVAIGRIPNTEELGLELAGVELTSRGYIKVNDRLQTTAPGVWAIGEVAGSPQFTHISVDDFRVVHANLTGGNRVTTGRQVPYCLFTDPELARIGLNETEAQAQGIPYRLFKVSMEANLRARTLSETRGFLKALVEAQSDRILGFTALSVGAGEIMAAVQVAMIGKLPYTALRDAVLTHPTLVEGLIPLFSSVPSVHDVLNATSTTAA